MKVLFNLRNAGFILLETVQPLNAQNVLHQHCNTLQANLKPTKKFDSSKPTF